MYVKMFIVAGQRALCHSRGDAETVNTITYSPMKSDPCKMEVTQQSSQFNCTIVKQSNESRELLVPEIMESVAAVEKEIESIDQFVQDSLQRFHNAEETVTVEKPDQKAAKHANKLAGKSKKDDNKEKHNLPCKKFSCVPGKWCTCDALEYLFERRIESSQFSRLRGKI